MNNEKDTKKTGVNSYGQTESFGLQTLALNPNYSHTEKKTSRLITALYMVTDCMETEDPIKGKLRFHGVQLMSDAFAFSLLSPVEKQANIARSNARISEILSLIEIAHTIGFISQMNKDILNREFLALTEDWKSFERNNSGLSFALDEKMFAGNIANIPQNKESFIKDKRTDIKMSFTIPQSNGYTFPKIKKTQNTNPSVDKADRTKRIIEMIKDKSASGDGVSIKDISTHFIECSEKTIQRELNTLVSLGKLKRVGAKRWSKYQIQ